MPAARKSATPVGSSNGIPGSAGLGREYSEVLKVLESFSRAELRTRQRRLDRAVEELGLQLAGSGGAADRPWQLDLFPAVLPAGEWELICRAVVQRALAFNAYAADMYDGQEVLRERVVPVEVALGDPAFSRQFGGIGAPDGEYSQFGAFDLVKADGGAWRVVEHHMGTPFGMGHVVQNRRILTQVFPEFFESSDVAPVADFSTLLVEMLRAQTGKRNPHVLLLTRGDSADAYFEETFLARHMGISIARPGDLLVREGQVYLKTIRGLEKIDVIYRRMESSTVDPIALPGTGAFGVPGLVNVVRKGRVAVVNALGAGVADNRALLRYADRIIGYYLNQHAVLRSVDTYHMGDLDQRSEVMDRRDELVLKPLQDHEALWARVGGRPAPGRTAAMEKAARARPDLFVAQELPCASSLPTFNGGRWREEGVFLRVYYILGEEPIVLPGGLTRQVSNRHRTRRLTIVSRGLKDTWVPEAAVVQPKPRRRGVAAEERFSIGSRIAETYYWAGRYLERAENTARQFNLLERLRWDQLGRSERQSYWPLYQAIASATGKTKLAKRRRIPRDTGPFTRSLLLDPEEPASVHACILGAYRSFEQVRETVSPECWEVLEDLAREMREANKPRSNGGGLRRLSETVVSELARFNGTAERTLLHDDVWQFYRIGIFLERAAGAAALLGVALPRIIENARSEQSESTDLTALLRVLGSLDAYHRQFRSRAYIDRVARLLVRGVNNPSSLNFCLRNLRYCFGTLSIAGRRGSEEALLGEADTVLDRIETFPLARMRAGEVDALDAGTPLKALPGTKPERVARDLEALLEGIEGLHQRIEDRFFSHQEAFVQEPTLFDPAE